MAMTEREQKEYRTYCSSLSSDYGFDISTANPISPAMYIFHKEMQLCIETNKEIASEIKSAASKIHPEVLHFSSSEAAWSFQLGIIYRWALFGGLTLLSIWIAVWWWSMKKEIDKARIIVRNSGNIDVLAKQVRQDKDGYYFIEFTAPRSDTVKYFTDFQVINAKTVRVFLGKESKHK